MSFNEYVKQLEQVNLAIQSCSDEDRDELLSLKNSLEELLSLAGENDFDPTESKGQDEKIDDEYALFMEMEGKMCKAPHTNFKAKIEHFKAEINSVSQPDSNAPKSEEDEADLSGFKEMEGKMCKAPHTNKWGSKGYHNAMICSVIPPNGENNTQVRVLFVNPTHEEMLPCPYYFETDCKFSEEKCKFSHGEIVPLSDIQEFTEPDFASLQTGSAVLALQKNKLWGRAKITRILEDSCVVKFETVKIEMELPFKEILPMTDDNHDSEGSDEEPSIEGVEIDQDVVNMSLVNTPTDGPLGDWEKFTKGIGSKLMQKMGYVVGTGLGKRSNGRIEPVTAVVLPPRKSLDYCMGLREKHGGDKNFFSIEKKLEKKKRRQEKRNEKKRKRALKKALKKEQKREDVFKFLNETLTNECSSSSTVYNKTEHRREIKGSSCRNLNVESFKTEENIKKTEKDINLIKESLSRHTDTNSLMHKNLKQRLNSTLSQLSDLQNQAQNIKNEQDNRKDKKKLTVF
ncbi:zinc finger CCCH-type with G patch domain-containing protein isoform X2 [Harmonia axyridis]|uniref:zinc finger CCCH-type with G patch domain-containing protein isoform X2 n=1 Tax=Harmonia axyridis TaxID=115357 RepID=UPI001E275F9F|nr:zinc finger CCCH-type with G patch domain-containing protein isoform X2 [Harmonia axyridis]